MLTLCRQYLAVLALVTENHKTPEPTVAALKKSSTP